MDDDIVARLLSYKDSESLTTTGRLMLMDCHDAAVEIVHLREQLESETEEADHQAEIVIRCSELIKEMMELLELCATEDLTQGTGSRLATFLKDMSNGK